MPYKGQVESRVVLGDLLWNESCQRTAQQDVTWWREGSVWAYTLSSSDNAPKQAQDMTALSDATIRTYDRWPPLFDTAPLR